MKGRIAWLTLVLAVAGGMTGASARPSAADVARAGTLAAQIKTPAVRAALQCRVAFADTTANVPIKDRADTAGAAAFWASYLQKLRAIDVAACPEDFRAAFDRHLRAVKSLSDSLNHPSVRTSPGPAAGTHYAGYGQHAVTDLSFNNADIKGHRDTLGDAGETYRAVFAAANKSMKTAPATDGQLAGQIDALLKE